MVREPLPHPEFPQSCEMELDCGRDLELLHSRRARAGPCQMRPSHRSRRSELDRCRVVGAILDRPAGATGSLPVVFVPHLSELAGEPTHSFVRCFMGRGLPSSCERARRVSGGKEEAWWARRKARGERKKEGGERWRERKRRKSGSQGRSEVKG